MHYEIKLSPHPDAARRTCNYARVKALLREHGAQQRPHLGLYNLRFFDGSTLELAAHGLEEEARLDPQWVPPPGWSWSWSCRMSGINFPVVQFLRDLALAADMILLPAGGGCNPLLPKNHYPILVRPSQCDWEPARHFPNVALAASARHLAQLLRPGYECKRAWDPPPWHHRLLFNLAPSRYMRWYIEKLRKLSHQQ